MACSVGCPTRAAADGSFRLLSYRSGQVYQRTGQSWPFPCRTVLRVTVLARFPALWTPITLAPALSTVRLWPSTGPEHDVISASRLEWGDPSQISPRFLAERNPRTGRWLGPHLRARRTPAE